MLFADNNTLWIGSQFCSTGERAKLNQNYNCLTMVTLGANYGAQAVGAFAARAATRSWYRRWQV